MTRLALRRPRLLSLTSAIFAALLFTCLAGPLLAAAAVPAPAVDAEQMHEHLDRLDEALDLRLERLARLPARERPSDAERQADTAELRRHLTALKAMIRRAAPAGADELLYRVHGLEQRVRELERWPEGDKAATTKRLSTSGALNLEGGPGGSITGTVTDAATGDPLPSTLLRARRVDDAYPVYEATAEANGGYTFDDLPPGTYRVFIVDAYDYLREIYDDLPCTHDCPFSPGTPVTVAAGQDIAGIDFALTRGGTLSGTVTAATGGPLSEIWVSALDSNGWEVASGPTDTAGRYTVSGLPAGSYFVLATSGFPYRSEVYDDVPCPANYLADCDLMGATAVPVTLDTPATGIDFALLSFGTISGTVTEAATGDPIPFVDVGILLPDGFYYALAVTDSNGKYATSGLEDGVYFAMTRDFGIRYIDEPYVDESCAPGCVSTLGTPITVRAGEVSTGIDLALRRLGVITGTVTDNATGNPTSRIRVWARDGSDLFLAHGDTDDNGYRIEGLPPGEYFLTTASFFHGDGGIPYVDELYDNLPCPRTLCAWETGTPVRAEADQVTSGIDFALDAAPAISGRVTADPGGTPLVGYRVHAYDAGFETVVTAITDATGAYTLHLGAPGTYFVRTYGFDPPDHSQPSYLDELYDNKPCYGSGGCNLTGTPITVGPGAHVDGVDFALKRLGAISGTVTSALGGPLPGGYGVAVWNAAGNIVNSASFLGNPSYTVYVPAGTFYVSIFSSDFGNELYDDLPCYNPTCDPTAGTPVTVQLGTTVSGIDFELMPLGSIAGRVTDAATGEPLAAFVAVWDENGFAAGQPVFGDYTLGPLVPGRYFVTATINSNDNSVYLGELYDNLPCPLGFCDHTTGSPVAVSLGAQTTGVDFALTRGGMVTGRVTDASGQPLQVALELWSLSGRLLRTATDSSGRYAFNGLGTGSYFVNTLSPYFDEAFDNLPCSNGCDPTTSTPIAVTVGEITPEIDFILTPVTTCSPSPTTLCLNDGRFRFDLDWTDFEHHDGPALGHQLTDDSGYFTFLDPDNVEVVVKVLRACFGPTPRYWVFAGGLTNLEVAMTVADTATGQSRRYHNPLGTAFELIRDTETFVSCNVGLIETEALTAELTPAALRELTGMGAVTAADKMGTCTHNSTTLCLGNGRFAVDATWKSATSPPTPAAAEPLTADTGYFTFLDPQNVEVVLKVLDACGLDPFHNFWVFAAGLTDLDVELRVTDTVSGEVQIYTNDLGDAFVPVQDTTHFATCP